MLHNHDHSDSGSSISVVDSSDNARCTPAGISEDHSVRSAGVEVTSGIYTSIVLVAGDC